MTITELINKNLVPIILSYVEENKIRHWWKIKDKRKESERLYYGCIYPLSSTKSFDNFDECLEDLKKVISNLKSLDLNEQFNQILNNDDNN